jgi:hypothetical protein
MVLQGFSRSKSGWMMRDMSEQKLHTDELTNDGGELTQRNDLTMFEVKSAVVGQNQKILSEDKTSYLYSKANTVRNGGF